MGAAGAVALALGFSPSELVEPVPAVADVAAAVSAACLPAEGDAPEYYRFPLVTTRRVPGTGNSAGTGEIRFPETPYGVALTPDGSYRYDFTATFERLKLPRDGVFVVWVTTPKLDRVKLAGRMTDAVEFSGQVEWNKFLLVITHEDAFDPDQARWEGPVVMRGMSRSGMMHTMAGHGPFEEEKCAAYGYE